MKNLAYFTEVMRTTYSMAKKENWSEAVNELTDFLKTISFDDLKQIVRESERGHLLLKMKENLLFVPFFVYNIPTEVLSFREWTASFSRSWNLLY